MTATDPSGDEMPGEGWRVYVALAGSFAAATPTMTTAKAALSPPHVVEILYGSVWGAFTLGLQVGIIFAAFVAAPPAAVYFLCRPPGRRLKTRRGWATLCSAWPAAAACSVFAERTMLSPSGWGVILLPATVVGLTVVAAAGLTEPRSGLRGGRTPPNHTRPSPG